MTLWIVADLVHQIAKDNRMIAKAYSVKNKYEGRSKVTSESSEAEINAFAAKMNRK